MRGRPLKVGWCGRLVVYYREELLVGDVSDVGGGAIVKECASGVAMHVRVLNHDHDCVVRGGKARVGRSEFPSCCAGGEAVVRVVGGGLADIVDVPWCERQSWQREVRVLVRWLCIL